jgi:putative sugar O-methyltransferase
MKKDILVWGAGIGAQALFKALGTSAHRIVAYVDADPEKWGATLLGRRVLAPEEAAGQTFGHLVVTCRAVDQVREQARALGLPLDRLVPFLEDPSACLERLGLSSCLYSEHMELCGDRAAYCSRQFPIQDKMVEDVPPPVPARDQEPLVARLLEAYARAAAHVERLDPLYQAGENWGALLKGHEEGLKSAWERDGIGDLVHVLMNFFRHDASMHILGGRAEYERFRRATSLHWLTHNHQVWQYSLDPAPDIREAGLPPIGNPYGVLVDGALINWNSFPNHWRASNCLRLLAGVERPVVAEIGGGFGCFAHFLQKLGGNVAYVNFDLPENLIISSYYLSMAHPDKRILLFQDPDMALTPAVFEAFDIILMPNFMVPSLADLSVDFFINTISFSEMELPTIAEYLRQIGRTCRRFLYHENLAHIPPSYKGFPSRLFPAAPGFREISASVARWMGLDAYAVNHTYLEHLLARRGMVLE